MHTIWPAYSIYLLRFILVKIPVSSFFFLEFQGGTTMWTSSGKNAVSFEQANNCGDRPQYDVQDMPGIAGAGIPRMLTAGSGDIFSGAVNVFRRTSLASSSRFHQ